MKSRPELFKLPFRRWGDGHASLSKIYHCWNWIAEYGSSDSAADFKNLYAYSPLHNIKKG